MEESSQSNRSDELLEPIDSNLIMRQVRQQVHVHGGVRPSEIDGCGQVVLSCQSKKLHEGKNGFGRDDPCISPKSLWSLFGGVCE